MPNSSSGTNTNYSEIIENESSNNDDMNSGSYVENNPTESEITRNLKINKSMYVKAKNNEIEEDIKEADSSSNYY